MRFMPDVKRLRVGKQSTKPNSTCETGEAPQFTRTGSFHNVSDLRIKLVARSRLSTVLILPVSGKSKEE